MQPDIDFKEILTNKGNNLAGLSDQSPLLLVFLRHFGCAFCRKAMYDLSRQREKYEKLGVKLIFFHLSDEETAKKYFKKYKLENIEFVTDPYCVHYSAFGLTKGTFNQLLGLKVLMKGIPHMLNRNTGWSTFIGDGFQMPGVFLVQNSEIKASFIHELASDEPDYEKIISCCVLKH
jgi:peroxiredoxin